MSRASVILACLIYARTIDHAGVTRFLMLHRNTGGSADFHAGKWNGLGGKCEGVESFFEAASREMFEESGLRVDASRFSALGLIQFPLFKPAKNEDWVCMVFDLELSESEVNQVKLHECKEGSLHWVAQDQVLDLPMWEGDHEFLPFVFNRSTFFGTIWYENGMLSRTDLRKS